MTLALVLAGCLGSGDEGSIADALGETGSRESAASSVSIPGISSFPEAATSPGNLEACFAPTPQLPTCDAYCASIDKACVPACVEAVLTAGLRWNTPGTCPDPDADKIVVTRCENNLLSVFDNRDTRCCCAD